MRNQEYAEVPNIIRTHAFMISVKRESGNKTGKEGPKGEEFG